MSIGLNGSLQLARREGRVRGQEVPIHTIGSGPNIVQQIIVAPLLPTDEKKGPIGHNATVTRSGAEGGGQLNVRPGDPVGRIPNIAEEVPRLVFSADQPHFIACPIIEYHDRLVRAGRESGMSRNLDPIDTIDGGPNIIVRRTGDHPKFAVIRDCAQVRTGPKWRVRNETCPQGSIQRRPNIGISVGIVGPTYDE